MPVRRPIMSHLVRGLRGGRAPCKAQRPSVGITKNGCLMLFDCLIYSNLYIIEVKLWQTIQLNWIYGV